MGIRRRAGLIAMVVLALPVTMALGNPTIDLVVPTASTDGSPRLPDALPDNTNSLPPVTLPFLIQPPKEPRPAPSPSIPTTNDGPSVGRYDPSLLYLPDYVPPSPRRDPCPCGPSGRFWLNASLFYGTINNEDIPPLLTAGGSAVLGDPGVTVLADEDRNAGFFRPGFLLSGGMWLNHCQTVGLEGSLLLLESNRAPFDFYSYGRPSFGRAYIDGTTGQPLTELVASDGQYAGGASLLTESQLIGGEANVRENLFCGKPWRVDSLAGYRFVRLREAIELNSTRYSLADFEDGPAGTRYVIHDRFATRNDFHGGQIGLAGEYRWGNVFFDATGKIAFGVVREKLEIDGDRAWYVPGALPMVRPGGLMAQPSNSGSTMDTRLAVVPEVAVSVGYQLGEHLRAAAGYTFLYMSNVGRPGHAIDRAVGNGHPFRRNSGDDFWMQGVNVGLEVRY